MCVLCHIKQPPMWVTWAVLPSLATWEDSTIHVVASVSPSQGEYANTQTHTHCTTFASRFSIKVSLVCFFRSVPREPNKTQVFSFFQTDLGGFLPRSVVDSFFPSSMAEFYSNLAKAVKSLKDLWHQQLRNLPSNLRPAWLVRPNVHYILNSKHNSNRHTEVIKPSLISNRSNPWFMFHMHSYIPVLLPEESCKFSTVCPLIRKQFTHWKVPK